MLWDETYPAIPGLGNLHGRFGFNSNLLLTSAAFSFKDLFGFRIYGLLSLFMATLFAWIITRIAAHNSVWIKSGLSFFLFAFFFLYGKFISSTSTDPLPNILVSFILLKAVLDREALKKSPLLFWVLPVFCLTLKLSVAPVCIFSALLCYNLFKEKNYLNLTVLLCIALLIVAPWCLRNIIITGYLIYPYPGIDLFSFDWKIPVELVAEEKGLISSWAKMPGLSLADFETMPFWEWTQVWLWRHIRYMWLYTFTFFLAGISPLVMLALARRRANSITRYQTTAWFIGACGSVFWFFMAPDVRFGYSFILAAGIVPFMLFDGTLKNAVPGKIIQYALTIGLAAYAIPDSYKLHEETKGTKPLASYLYAPQSINEAEKNIYPALFPHITGIYSECKIDSLTVYITNTGYCYEDCFPCIKNNPGNIEMRGSKVENGFRVKTNN
jgi:hypothetical protein